MRRGAAWVGGWAMLALLLGTAREVRAQRDLDARQSDDWYALHLTLLGVGVGGTVGTWLIGAPLAPRLQSSLWFEAGTEQNFSLLSSRVSDVTLLGSVVAPVGVLGVSASAERYENSLLIYGEVLSLQLWANALTKLVVARGRPYGVGSSSAARAYATEHPTDRVLSFYSGHASTSFAAAFAGGFLFSDGAADPAAQAVFWGFETSLAAFTAHARVRAGMHYPSDVLFGALVGTTFGVGLPLLHGVRPEIDAGEWVALGAGLAVGAAAGWLLPTRISELVVTYRPQIQPVAGGALLQIGSQL
ncbi:MAG TPA: phosphatase PAP2 family protein [Polyangiaceae bacterium]|nr:phosphatase PAP2 family protein [Polyangiaceae bacterium]